MPFLGGTSRWSATLRRQARMVLYPDGWETTINTRMRPDEFTLIEST